MSLAFELLIVNLLAIIVESLAKHPHLIAINCFICCSSGFYLLAHSFGQSSSRAHPSAAKRLISAAADDLTMFACVS